GPSRGGARRRGGVRRPPPPWPRAGAPPGRSTAAASSRRAGRSLVYPVADARVTNGTDGTRPRPEQPEDAGRRRAEAYAAYVEVRRRPRTKGCDEYRPGLL